MTCSSNIEPIRIGFKFSSPFTPPFLSNHPHNVTFLLYLNLSLSLSLLHTSPAGHRFSPFPYHILDHPHFIPPIPINSLSHIILYYRIKCLLTVVLLERVLPCRIALRGLRRRPLSTHLPIPIFVNHFPLCAPPRTFFFLNTHFSS